jgi:hypothetical protein
MTLRRTLPILVLALVAAPLMLRAQETPAPPGPPPAKATNQNVRIDVAISLKGDAKPLVKNLSMVAADGRSALGRAGIEVPVPSSFTPGTQTPATFNYRPVGVNVDAIPQILDATHVMVRLKLNFSTIYKSINNSLPQPSFGQGSHEAFGIVFDSGKPLIVTEATDGETGREYTVEVKATILK